MITVTSKNRTAAKRMLNNWHPSTQVRVWSLQELSNALQRAVNQALITEAGVRRALNIEENRQGGGSGSGSGGEASQDSDSESRDDESNDGDSGDSGDDDGDDGDDDDGGNEQQDAFDKGFEDGKDCPDSDNGMDADMLHGEQGDAYEAGYRQGQQEQNDGNDDGTPKSDEDESGDSDKSDSEDGDDDSESEDDDSGDDEQDEDEDEQNDEENDEEQEQDEDEQNDEENDTKHDGEHEMLRTVLKYISAGLNVALVGPAGSGKSYLARQVAALRELSFFTNGAMMSKYDLIGFIDAAGTYHDTPAYNAFTQGGVHCFDELDASAPDAVVAFNGMTDDQPFYTFPNGQQDQHDEYVAIACMNTWGNGASADYVGRYKQDAASMSRFVKVFIDYDVALERTLGPSDIVDRIHKLRAACTDLGIRHIVSTRMIMQATAARKAQATKSEIDRDILFAGLDDGAVEQIKATMRRSS